MMSKIIRNRLDDLAAADSLDVIRKLPQHRCHELTGNRKGQLAVDLAHPYRLIFKPDDDPPVTKTDGGIDWKRVKTILIIEIEDYH
jgi:proteic killer suppression protein